MKIKHLLASATAAAMFWVSPLSAATLNPQPEPPGKSQVMASPPSAATTMGNGGAAMGDDTYCGTRVPGHHINQNCRQNNAMTGGAVVHANAMAAGAGAGVASDADDNYCGTPTPGHPHAVACTNNNMAAHSMVGTTAGGAMAGGASMSDDNYCGTAVPGHPHVNSVQSNNMAAPGTASCANGSKVMLNPQPLPPGERTQGGMTH